MGNVQQKIHLQKLVKAKYDPIAQKLDFSTIFHLILRRNRS